MMRRKLTTLLLPLFLLVSPYSGAEPSPTVQMLMNDPLTRFEWGMHRIQNELDRKEFEGVGRYFAFSNYDWDTNRITITGVDPLFKGSKEQAKAACRNLLDQVRELAIVRDGKPRTGGKSLFANYFEPTTFGGSKYEKVATEIDKMIEVRIRVGHTVCTGPLVSNKVYFEE